MPRTEFNEWLPALLTPKLPDMALDRTPKRILAETLRYLDFDNVADSQLLGVLHGVHGGKGTIFIGSAGRQPGQNVASLARSIAQEKQAESRAELNTTTSIGGKTQASKPSDPSQHVFSDNPGGLNKPTFPPQNDFDDEGLARLPFNRRKNPKS